jgi:hypothetical protein
MAKRTSKAEIILRDARDYAIEAKDRRDSLRAQLDVAEAVYEALQLNYAALEQGLARKTSPKSQSVPSAGKPSRRNKPGDSSSPSSGTEKETASGVAVCDCGFGKLAPVHDSRLDAFDHIFRPVTNKKQKPISLPDNPEEFQHGATA